MEDSERSDATFETRVVDTVLRELQKKSCYSDIFDIVREHTDYKALKDLLATASKRGNDNIGKCDIILTPKNKKTKVYILIECKKNANKHGSLDDTSQNAVIGKAIPGTAHYMKHVWEKGNKSQGYTILGMAVSGMGSERKITVLGICNSQNHDSVPHIKILFDENYIPKFEDIMSQLYSFCNINNSNIPFLENYDNSLIVQVPLSVFDRLIFSRKVQRYYSVIHRDEIVASLLQRHNNKKSIILPGVIIIIVYNCEYYIIDGQHRFEAYKDYYKSYGRDCYISFQIFIVDTEESVNDIYETHYKAMAPTEDEKIVPVKKKKIIEESSKSEEEDVKAPKVKKVSKRGWAYDLTREVFELMSERWKIVNESTSPPNITRSTQMEIFEQYLKENEDFYIDYTVDDIMKILLKKNKKLANNPPTAQKSNPNKSYGELTLTKAKNADCYLGLIWANEWLL